MAGKNSIGVEKHPKGMGVVAASPSEGPRPLDDYDHQNHADTLMKAQEIMADPEKMNGAMIYIKKKAKAIKSVQDLKNFHQAKYGKGGDTGLEVEGKE